MLKTKLTQEYGLKAPIISAGMAFVADAPLAGAVSNAGGLGMLGCGMTPPDGLRVMIQRVRGLTPHPFGIDFITDFVTDEHIDVCIEQEVPVALFFWSLPDMKHIKRLKENGTKVWMQVGSVPDARTARGYGFDAIVVQGNEAGGHNRSVAATFSLLPAVSNAVAPFPIIAAGGIADGKGLVAALSLGADAVLCGTRFLASHEANAHRAYKERILHASVADTVRTTMAGPEWPNQPTRVLRNRIVEEWAGRKEEIVVHEVTGETIGETRVGDETVSLPGFSEALPTSDTLGDIEEMCLTAGESSGNIHTLMSAQEIIDTMVDEAEQIVASRLAEMLESEPESEPGARFVYPDSIYAAM